MTKQNPKMLSFYNQHVQLFRFMFSIKEGEKLFTVVWTQTVNPKGTIEGIGSFSQQNATYTKQKRVRNRRTHGAGMKERILELNRNYKLKQRKS